MKIITWNINGYRSITGQNPSKHYDVISNDNKLFAYINSSNPDVICLQETKANIEQISEETRFPKGFYGEYFSAQRKGYSGVATFVRKEKIDVKKEKIENANYQAGFGIEKFDVEGRVIVIHFSEFSLLNVYFPNGKKDEDRLLYKLDFYKSLFNYTEELRKKQPNIIICGDYNTAHKPIDLARPKENEKVSGFLPIEREKLDDICLLGYVDAFRVKNNEAGQYSWWSNLGQARAKNIGWRIDYFFVTESLVARIKDCYLDPTVFGSDHCPLVLEMDF
jgi:exodeoxyribonuclease-3